MQVHNNRHILSHLMRQNRKRHNMHRRHQTSVIEVERRKTTESELENEALLALLGGWANSFIDGMTVSVAFSDDPIRGVTIGIAILSQQFPNEVG